jgi:hypothetical protein
VVEPSIKTRVISRLGAVPLHQGPGLERGGQDGRVGVLPAGAAGAGPGRRPSRLLHPPPLARRHRRHHHLHPAPYHAACLHPPLRLLQELGWARIVIDLRNLNEMPTVYIFFFRYLA